jgi:hypothetical protein
MLTTYVGAGQFPMLVALHETLMLLDETATNCGVGVCAPGTSEKIAIAYEFTYNALSLYL